MSDTISNTAVKIKRVNAKFYISNLNIGRQKNLPHYYTYISQNSWVGKGKDKILQVKNSNKALHKVCYQTSIFSQVQSALQILF